MKLIPLTKGKTAVVDDEDYDYLNQFNWQLSSGGYAKTGVKGYYMHRVIMRAPEGRDIDHVNGNKLDNRKENLRFLGKTNNKIRKDNTSGYNGVSYFKPRNSWVVRIQVNGKRLYFGSYKTREEAIMASIKAQMVYLS